MKEKYSSIEDAITSLKKGKMIVLIDHLDRENQGDCVFPAEKATIEKVRFILNECKGQLCVPLSIRRAASLKLSLMVPAESATEKTKLQFTVSADARTVKSFGISASDKLKTIQMISNSNTKPHDLVRPGHVFPIMENQGGLSERKGHTEATLALCRLAGFQPVGVLAEILDERAEPADKKYLFHFGRKNKLPVVTIADLESYLKSHPLKKIISSTITRVSIASLPTIFGKFNINVFRSLLDNREHIALSIGDLSEQPVLTRIHSQCITGDTLGSLRCDCKQQLEKSMKIIGRKGNGIILYLNQEGRGIGLENKIKAYTLQDKGLDTVEANHSLGFPPDIRNYGLAAEILKDFGINQINLLTNNPDKEYQLSVYGIRINKSLPLESRPNGVNNKYLFTKKQKLNHRLKMV